ncbi:MAG: hypothetical protein ABIO70_25915 [Pseudomonadota bacterium]
MRTQALFGFSRLVVLAAGLSAAGAVWADETSLSTDQVVAYVDGAAARGGGTLLVGLAGREAQRLGDDLPGAVPAYQLILVPVAIIGYPDEEMQRLMQTTGVDCAVRISFVERGAWNVAQYGACERGLRATEPMAASAVTTVGGGAPAPPNPAATPVTAAGRVAPPPARVVSSSHPSSHGKPSHRKSKEHVVDLRLLQVDLAFSEDELSLGGIGGEVRVQENFGLGGSLQIHHQRSYTTLGADLSGRAYAVDFDKGPFVQLSLGVVYADVGWDAATGVAFGAAVGAKYTFDPPLFVDAAFGGTLLKIPDEDLYKGLSLFLGAGWAF